MLYKNHFPYLDQSCEHYNTEHLNSLEDTWPSVGTDERTDSPILLCLQNKSFGGIKNTVNFYKTKQEAKMASIRSPERP